MEGVKNTLPLPACIRNTNVLLHKVYTSDEITASVHYVDNYFSFVRELKAFSSILFIQFASDFVPPYASSNV